VLGDLLEHVQQRAALGEHVQVVRARAGVAPTGPGIRVGGGRVRAELVLAGVRGRDQGGDRAGAATS
jgi:hypothetical protein